MASVKVAVRVRPFNQRELDMGAKSVIQMDGKKTRIMNTKMNQPGSSTDQNTNRERYKDFTFDHSYWSFDPADPHFASQEQVFADLGTDVVDSAFEGYNACVFAYGQTGSGKTFTMMGSVESQGLIPRICKTLFSRMQAGQECGGQSYRVDVSYLEIYNERVKDLLSREPTHSLRVREHPRHGPYVQELSHHLVTDYAHILELMARGNRLRTTASTNMNDVSSRSHAIFTLTFLQAGLGEGGLPCETTSKVHLVDLAGSERADATGATGQRLKEGAHINKSLVTLGSVISALAELSTTAPGAEHPRRSAFIPYRDSVLTWLLKDSLGGNSKTIMIAAISPADCNHGETLSTLRYANRAKNIINKPTVNEDPNVRLIRELREEILKLRCMLGNSDHVPGGSEPRMLAELQQKEAQEKVLTAEWAEKWRETQAILREQQALGLRKAGRGVVLDSDRPHLVGIDDDRLSTGVTLYHLKEGETVIGSSGTADIILAGLEAMHCSLVLKEGSANLIPREGAQCWVNSVLADRSTKLYQGCILMLGRTHMFRYNDPAEAAQLRKEGSRSQLNLSRLSLLSWSSPELACSAESLLANGDDQEKPERLMSHLLNSSKDEGDPSNWETRLQQKKDALEEAQRELEIEREHLEREFEERTKQLERDRLALEQRQAEAERVLKERELQLQMQREEVERQRQQEAKLVAEEAAELAALQTKLDEQRCRLREAERTESENSKNASAGSSREALTAVKDLVAQQRSELAFLEEEVQARLIALNERQQRLGRLDEELVRLNQEQHGDLKEARQSLAQRSQLELEEMKARRQSLTLNLQQLSRKEKEAPTNSSNSSESSAETGSFHTAASQGPATDWLALAESIVSPPPDTVARTEAEGLSDSGVGLLNGSPSHSSDSSEHSPWHGEQQRPLVLNGQPATLEVEVVKSHVKPDSVISNTSDENVPENEHDRRRELFPDPLISPEISGELGRALAALANQVVIQKERVLRALEDERCDKDTLNRQIVVLQELQKQHVRLESLLENTLAKRIETEDSEEAPESLATDADDRLSEFENMPASTRIMRRHSAADAQNPPVFTAHIVQSHRGTLRLPLSPVRFSSVTSLDRGSVSPYSLGQSLVYCSPLLSPASCMALEESELQVSVPSYLLRGAGAGTHYEYEVRVSVGGNRWTLLRRYKRFRELHLAMRSKYGSQVDALPFPPRKFFAKNSETVARQRRRQLEVYLQKLLAVCSQIPECPLYSCREHPSRLALLEFSSFFRKGVFEAGKAGTS